MSAVFFELPDGELFNLRQVNFFEGKGRESLLYLDPVELIPTNDSMRPERWSKPFEIFVPEQEMLLAFRDAHIAVLNLNHAGIIGAPVHVVVEKMASPLSSARMGYDAEKDKIGSHIHFACGKILAVRQTPKEVTDEIRVHALAKIIPSAKISALFR